MADLGGRNPVCGTACRWNAAHFHACIFTGVYDRNIWDIDQQSGKPQAILRTANRLSRQDDALFYYSHVYTNGVDWRSSLWRRQLPDGLAGGLFGDRPSFCSDGMGAWALHDSAGGPAKRQRPDRHAVAGPVFSHPCLCGSCRQIVLGRCAAPLRPPGSCRTIRKPFGNRQVNKVLGCRESLNSLLYVYPSCRKTKAI